MLYICESKRSSRIQKSQPREYMSILDDTYINDEQVPTIGERNLIFQYSVNCNPLMPRDVYFKYQDTIVQMVSEIKAGHSLKVRYLDAIIKKYFPPEQYEFNIQTNFRTMKINISTLINIFDSNPIAKVEITCRPGNRIDTY